MPPLDTSGTRPTPSVVDCDCPARVLDPKLIGMRCEICFGYFPPFDKVDQMIYAKWKTENEADQAARLGQWRAGQ